VILRRSSAAEGSSKPPSTSPTTSAASSTSSFSKMRPAFSRARHARVCRAPGEGGSTWRADCCSLAITPRNQPGQRRCFGPRLVIGWPVCRSRDCSAGLAQTRKNGEIAFVFRHSRINHSLNDRKSALLILDGGPIPTRQTGPDPCPGRGRVERDGGWFGRGRSRLARHENSARTITTGRPPGRPIS
jgi:hypothetical protein